MNRLVHSSVKVILLVVFSCFLNILKSQDQRIADSLIHVLSEAKYSDSLRVHILTQISFNHNDPSKSLQYAEKVLEIAENTDRPHVKYQGHYLSGLAYNKLGDLENAIMAYTNAANYATEENPATLGALYLTLGDVYSDQESHETAINYYSEAIEQLQLIDALSWTDSLYLGTAFINLGYEHYRVDYFDSALMNHQKADSIFTALDYPTGSLYCAGNIGLVYAKMGDHDLAERNMQEAISGLRKYEDYYAISDFEKEIADIYRQKKDFKQALQYAMGSLEVSEEMGLKVQARDASYKLYEIYMDTEKYGLAIQYLNKYYAFRDSITNSENIQRIADLRTEFEVGQKQAEVDLLTAEKDIQRLVRISLIVGLGLVVIFAMIQYRNNIQKKKTNRILTDQKVKLEELNQTKDRFFSIISHDLRGPINAFHGVPKMIKYFVQQKQMGQLEELAEDIDQSVDRLSSLLDNLLNWAVQQQGNFPYVPEKIDVQSLAEDLVRTFTTMADSKQIKLVAEVEAHVEAWADRNTTMTIIRNLVGNALKFTPHQGEVLIKACYNDENEVLVQVQDNGVGIPEEKLNDLFKLQAKKSTWGTDGEKGLGLGLQLVYDFVQLNKGKIDVQSAPDQGTTFAIWLPSFQEARVLEKIG